MKIKDLRFLRQAIKPITKVFAGKKKLPGYFDNVNKDLLRYENIYRGGGLISQAVDSYPLFGLSPGYTLEGEPRKVKEIEKWFIDINIEELMWQAWVDALVYGDAIQENVYNAGGRLLYLIPRNSKYFKIDLDEWGMVESYTQRVNSEVKVLKPEKITALSLITVSGEGAGISLIQRAFDDIMRDTKTAESTTVAIERHGYPRFHIKAGSEDTEYSPEDKETIAREFEELKPDNEFVTNPDIEIVAIDTQGIGKIKEYNEWSLSRMLGAMGVPSEVVGTGQNVSTYATASVEMTSFIKKVETQRKKIARCFNEVIALRLRETGQVTLKFNPIDEEGLANTSNTQQKNNQEVI